MKPIALAFAALAGTVAAQYTVTSSPFKLMLKSDNATIDGTALGACHAGAAIETLCPTSGTSGSTFYHNVSASDPANAIDTPGILVYVLHGAGFEVPSAMHLNTSPGSAVTVPVFSPGPDSDTTVEFEDCGSMYIANQVNTKSWYLCLTSYGYTRITLAWNGGLTTEPQDPTCRKVDVERVWI